MTNKLQQLAQVLDEQSNLSLASRRSFAKKIGLASVLLGGGALASTALLETACGGVNNLGVPITPGPNPAITDADILNFALNLEYLEADFYTVATTGMTIDQIGIGVSGTGNAGSSTGGAKVAFSDPVVKAIAMQIAADEQDHVKLLRSALGAAAVARPAINLNALGVGFKADADFLVLARAFEDTGVSAYGGAAPLISSSSILGTAARILAVEAEHAGNIREMIVAKAIAVSALDSIDVVPTTTAYFAVDSNGLSKIRTTRQVLDIVYAGTGSSGGFFPLGLNGTIKQ